MAIRIRQLHPSFVGEVSGIDIARALSRDQVEAIEAGMREHAVLQAIAIRFQSGRTCDIDNARSP